MVRDLLVTPINNSSSYIHSRHTLAKKEKLHRLSSPQEVLPIHEIGQGINLSNNASAQEHVQALRAVSKHLPPTLIAPAKAEEIFYVECQVEPSTQQDVVLWDDILQAFEGAVHVRHQAKVVPFLKGLDFRPYVQLWHLFYFVHLADIALRRKLFSTADIVHCALYFILNSLQPRRIIAVPNTVLDVIVSGELVNTVVPQGPRSMSFHENSEGTMKAKQDNDFQENTVSNTASTGVRRNPVYGLENTAMDAYRDNDNPDWAPRPRAPQTIPSEKAGDSSAPGSHEPNNSTQTMRAPQETVSAAPRDFTQTTFNAGLGDKDAQVALGAMYEDGKVIPQDYQAAMDWYSKAAEQGDSEGQRRVGLLYALGLGVAQDITLAIDWCRRAANQGNFAAEVDVGHLYYYSLGPLQDFQWAMAWYITAAHHGVAVAQHHVGLLFENGQGTPQDDSQALHWYQRAANQGFAKAQSKLGLMYYKGRGGLPQDYMQAMKWCLKAAEQGHAQTQTHVGYMYQSGQGAARDYVQAVKWYRLAADQGEAAAQYNIGILYNNGFGVARDVGKAAEWYRKAADQGFAKAMEAVDALERLGHRVA
jgi:TPR repeat protein